MRVVANEKIKFFAEHVAIRLDAGQEAFGEAAALLLERVPGKVTRLDDEPDTPPDRREATDKPAAKRARRG
ncbi:hypothetical protein [Streptomyces vilmorinianum]|uniref:hypothetical protein n=1 Tax=Streptomyces vilmorinianum TaxID=3051092 RepID=UPI0010FB736D|nr:hypothetical protein [Streptomyces vilmorinianum]